MLMEITKQSYHNVTRNLHVLNLIHSDLCVFHSKSSLGNKKDLVTFINYSTRLCYAYLLHAKDEAFKKFNINETENEL